MVQARKRAGWTAMAAVLLAGCASEEVRPVVARAESRAHAASAFAPQTAGHARTACDLAVWLVGETLGVDAEPAGRPVSDSLGDAAGQGCRLTAVGSFDELPDDVETPVDLLYDAYDEGGWFEDTRYASDTEESSALGMWKEGVLCVIGAFWMAPDEYADEDYEPAEEELRYDLAVECVPAEVPPIPLWGAAT